MIPKRLKVDGIRFVLLEKGGKRPFQKDWQKKNISFDNLELIKHLKNGGNYGVLGGGEKNLVVVDFDNESVQKEAVPYLPQTFTVKTGSGLLHKYFFSDKSDSFKIFNEEMDTLLDVQGEGKQVVGAGSIHPNGSKYQVVDDSKIAYIDYSELKAFLSRYDKKPRKEKRTEKYNPERFKKLDDTNFAEVVLKQVKLSDVLKDVGVDTSKNLTNCPFHSSKGGKCLGFNEETWHCFHCEDSGNIFSLVMRIENLSFKDTLEWFADKYNLKEEFEQCKKNYIEKNKENANNLTRDCLSLIINKREDKASELIVEWIEKNNNIYTTRDDNKTEIWFYVDGIFVPNGKSKIKELTRKILAEAYTPIRLNKVLTKIEADTMIDADIFFNTNHLKEIPVQNGILNLETLELSHFTPDKIFFNKLPVIYDAEATCPKIEKFFKEILKDPSDSEVLFELFGYCLWKDHFIEKACMFVGDGRNGKGKTISLLKSFLGAENCCSVPLSQLKPESTSVCELHGKFANLAGDLNNNSLKQTGLFKEITGRDMIGAKRKYLRDLFFTNYSKQIFACNELPRVYDTSEGFWERWMLFEFPYKFVKKKDYDKLSEVEKKRHKIRDPNIISSLTTPEELSGLLNRAIVGLKTILKNKSFSYSVGLQEIKDLWIRKSDSFMAFCLDNIEEDYESSITKREIRRRFSKYCKDHKVRGCGDRGIKITLENLFGAYDDQEYEGLHKIRLWRGIKWRAKKTVRQDRHSIS
jgi:P4 family phage/plasmid primase-like protien